MMKKFTFFMALLFCLINAGPLWAQASLREIPLQQQVEASNLIIEGKVISQKSFWDLASKNIYTSNTIEVFKVFKGEESIEYVDVVTLGGVVGLTAQISSHSLQLAIGRRGVFMLNPTNKLGYTQKMANKRYEAYSGIQGFYKYNMRANTANNVFNSYKDIEKGFYNHLESLTKQKIIKVKQNAAVSLKSKKNTSGLAVTIANISPTSIVAGEKAILTITGSGFGTTAGTIGFPNADDGGATLTSELLAPDDSPAPIPIASQIINWNDTTIEVEVPTEAGTGPVSVFHSSNGMQASSSQTLTVTHAELNVVSAGTAYQVQHVNDNGSGGYTWEMFTDFFNDTEHPGAKAAFESALDSWRCETKVNWTVSGVATTVDVIGVDGDIPPDGRLDADGTNVVRFDNGSELEAGVLGRCTSWYSGCSTGGTPNANWFVSEIDVVFDDATDWYFGSGFPSFSQYDFHSVALHELGHAHQLGHVIDDSPQLDNSNDVMIYALQNSEQQRVLSTENIAGGNSVHDRSTTIVPCGGTSVMSDSTICNLSVEEDELNNAITLYPNPAKNQFHIYKASFINLEKAVIYDISGRLISEHDLSNPSNTKTIKMQNASKGIYFVNIHSDFAMITKKMVLD
ncbi:T9SS type A sorting domain-containing protein [Hwangdonia lutea]|uniref:T9SS type A sorting domain-containing protein n=1 Tax=Hwangdonia lutea TaxID=3075823 RepID=A0AA97HRB9_9FLAO|nr:T9SS type A sorting domain-containing protein [Hwangdonia sp. SCSIO 19198]WOD44776.1 T9SS type A sorting domain-containing protein [Hwangdonia sp. SCSIO 19198]